MGTACGPRQQSVRLRLRTRAAADTSRRAGLLRGPAAQHAPAAPAAPPPWPAWHPPWLPPAAFSHQAGVNTSAHHKQTTQLLQLCLESRYMKVSTRLLTQKLHIGSTNVQATSESYAHDLDTSEYFYRLHQCPRHIRIVHTPPVLTFYDTRFAAPARSSGVTVDAAACAMRQEGAGAGGA